MVSIFSQNISPRLKYITQLVFDEILGVRSEIITKEEEVYSKEFVVNYSYKEGVGLKIFPDKFIFEKRIFEFEPDIGEQDGMVTLFPTGSDDFSFDIFSASFYLVSRYEEYLPHRRDQHGRFVPEQSIAFRHGFLEQPIINIWARYLKLELSKRYPNLSFNPREFKYINTIDVDSAFAYVEKGVIRSSGALLRDLITGKWEQFQRRLMCLAGLANDPFDTFDFILNLHRKHQLRTIFFFHVGDYGKNDRGISASSQRLQSLIKGVQDYAEVGIHPSYSSYGNKGKLEVELLRLARVVHQPISMSRNHFIRLSFPQTYRDLIELDVKQDFTMGYASKMGFRASICTPFYFYDLDFESPTNLKIYPFYLMEATICYYMREGHDNAMSYFRKYIDTVYEYEGTFVSLWHNSSLSEQGIWKGWRKVYLEMLEYVLKKTTSVETR